jgi:FtsH-binding integral membrane protein
MTIQPHQTSDSTRRTVRLASAGLVLAVILAVNDALLVTQQVGDGDPVVIVILVCAVLTVVAVPFAWRGSGRGRHTVVVTRALSALTGLPAFFVADVPTVGVVMAAVGIVLAVIVAVLVYSGSKQAR